MEKGRDGIRKGWELERRGDMGEIRVRTGEVKPGEGGEKS